MATTRALKHAPWSASKVQTALRCPRLFHYRYVDKLREPEVMPETRVGKAVHQAIELALGGMLLEQALAEGSQTLASDDERTRFDTVCASLPEFLERIAQFRRAKRVTRSMVEYSLAIRENLSAAPFYAGDAFYRGIIDLAYLYGGGNLAVVDHKSGRRSSNLNITEQLEGYAVLAAAGFRQVQRVWLGVHWVGSGAIDWAPPMSIAEINQRLLPGVMANIEAAALAVDDGPRATPSPWCERCSYRTVCPEGQDARFEPVDEDPEPWW